jgi:hypothetical protein
MECWKVVRTTVRKDRFSSPYYEAGFTLGEWSGVSGSKRIPLPWYGPRSGPFRSYVVGFHAYTNWRDAMDALSYYRQHYGRGVVLVRATMQGITAIGVEDIADPRRGNGHREVGVVVGRLIRIEEVVA